MNKRDLVKQMLNGAELVYNPFTSGLTLQGIHWHSEGPEMEVVAEALGEGLIVSILGQGLDTGKVRFMVSDLGKAYAESKC
jgi:hypothetical protein